MTSSSAPLSIKDQAAADALIAVRRLSLSERTSWVYTVSALLYSMQLAEELAFPTLYEVTDRVPPPRVPPPPHLRIFDLEITVYSDLGDTIYDSFRIGSFLLDSTRNGAVSFVFASYDSSVEFLLPHDEEVAAMLLRCLLVVAGLAHTPPHQRTVLLTGVLSSDESDEQGFARVFASSLFLLGWPPFCRLLSTLSAQAHEILSRLWSWDIRPYAAAYAQLPPPNGDPFVWGIHDIFLQIFTPLLPQGTLPLPTSSSPSPSPRRRAAT